jgi:hypothetical protein
MKKPKHKGEEKTSKIRWRRVCQNLKNWIINSDNNQN